VIGRKTLNEQLVGHSVKNGGSAPAVAVRTPVTLSLRWRCMSVASMSGGGGRPRPNSSSKDRHNRHGCDWSASTRSVQYVCCFCCSIVQSRRDAERSTQWRPMTSKKRVDLRGGRLSPDAEHSASPYDEMKSLLTDGDRNVNYEHRNKCNRKHNRQHVSR